jgi:hypothetical protein
MKKIVAVTLIIATLLCLGGCHKPTLEGYQLFRSTPLGFSVEYPETWSKAADNAEGTVAFKTPTEGLSDQWNEVFAVQTFKPDMEYEAYLKGYVADLETRKGYKIVTETETTLGGEKAYQIVYELSDEEEGSLRFLQRFALHKDKVYVVSFIGQFESYSYFLPFVDKMLGTFKFI